MVGAVVEVHRSRLRPGLDLVLVIPFGICLILLLMELKGSIGAPIKRHVRMKLVCEMPFVICSPSVIAPDMQDDFGASELVDGIILCFRSKKPFFKLWAWNLGLHANSWLKGRSLLMVSSIKRQRKVIAGTPEVD